MKPSTKVQALTQLIEPAVNACGLKLWGVEFGPQGKRSFLRVYIEIQTETEAETAQAAQNPDLQKTQGVSVDDCMKVSHQISGVLDVHDPIHGEYILEVSSPGWDRRFFKPEQMQAYIGEQVALRLVRAQDGRRKITGELLLVTCADQCAEISLSVEGFKQPVILSSDNIDKANLVYQD